MRFSRAVFFVWYFVMAGSGGSFAPRIYMQFGPYDTEEECKAYIAEILAGTREVEKGVLTFRCWEYKGACKK